MNKWNNGHEIDQVDERSFARSTREQILYLFILVMFIIISIIVGGQSSTVMV
ncbi:MAG: hypothetical protein K6G42_05870 [Lachnospiraceae bacterium]|nr:hypothetical protein [Lachnospiraceae bacterium]